MPIPADQMAQITGGQSDLAAIKTALQSLITRAETMYTLRAGDAVGRNACMDTKGGAQELLGLVNQYHADIAKALIVSYGIADAGPIILGGGGGRG